MQMHDGQSRACGRPRGSNESNLLKWGFSKTIGPEEEGGGGEIENREEIPTKVREEYSCRCRQPAHTPNCMSVLSMDVQPTYPSACTTN